MLSQLGGCDVPPHPPAAVQHHRRVARFAGVKTQPPLTSPRPLTNSRIGAIDSHHRPRVRRHLIIAIRERGESIRDRRDAPQPSPEPQLRGDCGQFVGIKQPRRLRQRLRDDLINATNPARMLCALQQRPHRRRHPRVLLNAGRGHSQRRRALSHMTPPNPTRPAILRTRRAHSHPRHQRHTTQRQRTAMRQPPRHTPIHLRQPSEEGLRQTQRTSRHRSARWSARRKVPKPRTRPNHHIRHHTPPSGTTNRRPHLSDTNPYAPEARAMSQPANTDNTENRSVQPQGHTAPTENRSVQPQRQQGHTTGQRRSPALRSGAAVTGDAQESPRAGQWRAPGPLNAWRSRSSRASGRPVGEPLVDDPAGPADGVRAQPKRLGERAVGAPSTQRPSAHAYTVQHIRHTQHRLDRDPR